VAQQLYSVEQLKELSKVYNAVDPDKRDDWMKAKIKAVNDRAIVSFGLAKNLIALVRTL
jgi:hypothetical protein